MSLMYLTTVPILNMVHGTFKIGRRHMYIYIIFMFILKAKIK